MSGHFDIDQDAKELFEQKSYIILDSLSIELRMACIILKTTQGQWLQW